MVIRELEEFAKNLKQYDRLMGIDLGTKTIGLALSDVMRMVASPLETLAKGKFSKDVAKLKALIEKEEVSAIVLGLPREMDGTEGKRCQATKAFASNLSREIDLPILLWDERLSTVAVERVLINEADMTRKRRAEVVDRAAAAYILQGALDALEHQHG
ncbi:putative Holliday junction resolvase [Candidatus Terasakiella magnetica]|uniref:Putative pre-16S rRNA nuclease n=1 Tax=Candidatus Terasakiella magnetica TaxID=1867952 RepID=A0A1C3RJV4_9PROT|nr:Holliday junction resolvase RuvX [Candidatus Terasakiella magnetica]SCA57570.1 putative Holliday junction resolvase [Candidatus Terasakiella magnetica]